MKSRRRVSPDNMLDSSDLDTYMVLKSLPISSKLLGSTNDSLNDMQEVQKDEQ